MCVCAAVPEWLFKYVMFSEVVGNIKNAKAGPDWRKDKAYMTEIRERTGVRKDIQM